MPADMKTLNQTEKYRRQAETNSSPDIFFILFVILRFARAALQEPNGGKAAALRIRKSAIDLSANVEHRSDVYFLGA